MKFSRFFAIFRVFFGSQKRGGGSHWVWPKAREKKYYQAVSRWEHVEDGRVFVNYLVHSRPRRGTLMMLALHCHA